MLPIESVRVTVGSRVYEYSNMEAAHKLIELKPTVKYNCIISLIFPFKIVALITVEQFYNLIEYSHNYLIVN